MYRGAAHKEGVGDVVDPEAEGQLWARQERKRARALR